MVNIWDYEGMRLAIKLTDINHHSYIGKVLVIWDAEETEDTEDCMDIELDSGEIKSFYPDEIESIEVLEGKKK